MLDNLNGVLTVSGAGATTLTLDDTGSSGAKSMVLTNSTVSGLSPAAVSYSTLAALNVLRGGGISNVTVNSTAGVTTTTIDTGSGNDAFTVVPASTATGRLAGRAWPGRWCSMAGPGPTPCSSMIPPTPRRSR